MGVRDLGAERLKTKAGDTYSSVGGGDLPKSLIVVNG